MLYINCDGFMNDLLPLSWIRTDQQSSITNVRLQNTASQWFALAEITSSQTFRSIIEQSLENNQSSETVIRGCGDHHINELKGLKFKHYFIGLEAVLKMDGDHFNKKSVRELIRRGAKSGEVKEIYYSKENSLRLEKFKQRTKLGDRPNLEYLFQNTFFPGSRLFVHENKNGGWNGAVVISRNSNLKAQSELLLRCKVAPPGVMENLIYNVFLKLKSEGEYAEWSLGEVRFVYLNKNDLSLLSRLILFIGRSFRFAYNYRGLHFFKNKFNPVWENVFVLARPKLKFSHLVVLFIKTNLAKLVWFKLIHREK